MTNQNTNPTTLSEDPDFLALYSNACAMGALILRSGADLPVRQRRVLISELRSSDQARLNKALASIGVTQTMIDEQGQHAFEFAERHSLPDSFSEILPMVSTAAKQGFPDGGPAPDPLDDVMEEVDFPDTHGGSGGSDGPDSAADECLLACQVEGLALAAVAVTTYLTALAACAVSGPAWGFCALTASAAYGLALYQMDASIDGCVAGCG